MLLAALALAPGRTGGPGTPLPEGLVVPPGTRLDSPVVWLEGDEWYAPLVLGGEAAAVASDVAAQDARLRGSSGEPGTCAPLRPGRCRYTVGGGAGGTAYALTVDGERASLHSLPDR